MTYFEELANEMRIKITRNDKGLYTGMTKALAEIANEILLSDDIKVFNLMWEEQKEIIKKRFYEVFPYMR